MNNFLRYLQKMPQHLERAYEDCLYRLFSEPSDWKGLSRNSMMDIWISLENMTTAFLVCYETPGT